MKCILINKNTEVLIAEYDSGTGVFTKIYDIYDIEYAPYILKKILVIGLEEEVYPHGEIN